MNLDKVGTKHNERWNFDDLQKNVMLCCPSVVGSDVANLPEAFSFDSRVGGTNKLKVTMTLPVIELSPLTLVNVLTVRA